MKYFRKTSRIAWVLGLTALLAACSSVKTTELMTPCDACLVGPCLDFGLVNRMGPNMWPIPAYTLAAEGVDAKVSAWLGPLDDRRYIYWSSPQTNVRRERSARQEEPLDSRRRHEPTRRDAHQFVV
jgi:hypothetical protein